jgi:hypothetical protein
VGTDPHNPRAIAAIQSLLSVIEKEIHASFRPLTISQVGESESSTDTVGQLVD